MKQLPLFRCYNCEKVLGRIEGKAEIKCPRCRSLNIISNSKHLGIRMKAPYRGEVNKNKKRTIQ